MTSGEGISTTSQLTDLFLTEHFKVINGNFLDFNLSLHSFSWYTLKADLQELDRNTFNIVKI